MARIKFAIGLTALVGLAVLCVVQFQALARLREENNSLRHQLNDARLASAAVSNEPVGGRDALTQAQLSELLKLRAEVTLLREQTNAMAKLREENEQLQVRASAPSNATNQGASATAGEELHDKELWAFAGYGTPERAIQSLLWAFSQTNKEAFLAGVDSNSSRYAEILNDTNFVRHASDESSKIKNFRFAAPTETFGDFSMVSIYMEGTQPGDKGEAQDVLFKKNGDSWQIVGAGNGVNRAGTSSSQP